LGTKNITQNQKDRQFYIILYSLFLIGVLSGFAVLSLSWFDQDRIITILSGIYLIVFTLTLLFIIISINRYGFRQELVKHRGMLCGNPTCLRCRGWYLAFLPSILSIMVSPGFWIDFSNRIIPWSFIISLIVFFIVAPVHGYVGRLFEKEGDDLIKFIMGIIAALSLIILITSTIALFF